jgi:nitrogenase-associated protein
MARVIFWEKPGCAANARQRAALAAAGHEVDRRDLLAEPWTAAALETFLGALPVADWFNPAAPQVKSGAVDPAALDAAAALALLVATPLLIRRPLMDVDGFRAAGWDPAALAGPLGGGVAPVDGTCGRTRA